MESALWVCFYIISGVSLIIHSEKIFKYCKFYFTWLKNGREPVADKIVVTRVSKILLCANHTTGILSLIPVFTHTTKECELKHNIELYRLVVVAGSGIAGGYIFSSSSTPVTLAGAFAGGIAGGLTYDCAASIVLTHCSDNKIVLFGHCENLHVLFCEDATQDEHIRQILCLVFRILVDGFAGVIGYRTVARMYSQINPTAPKIDLQCLHARSVTKEYKELEGMMKKANKYERKILAKKIVALRRKAFDMYGDGDRGHQERIDNYVRFLMKE